LLTLYEARRRRQFDAAAEFYNSIAGAPFAGYLRGQIMERQVLKYFDSLKAPQIFTVRSLLTPPTGGILVLLNVPPSSLTHSLRLSNLLLRRNNLYTWYLSIQTSLWSIRLSMYDPDVPVVLTGIQITISGDRNVAVSGLKRIQGGSRGVLHLLTFGHRFQATTGASYSWSKRYGG